MPYIGKSPVGGGFHKLDNLTASATATYALTLGSAAYFPETANQLLVSLNGVIQAPQDSFTVSGSNLIFDTALTASDSIDFVVALGDVLGVQGVTDGAVTTNKIANGAVTMNKLATSGTLPALDGSNLTGVGVAGITSSSTSGTALSIDANNIVTTPTRHCFWWAYSTGGPATGLTGVINWNVTEQQSGGHTAGTDFTCPVAGLYQFNFNAFGGANSSGGNVGGTTDPRLEVSTDGGSSYSSYAIGYTYAVSSDHPRSNICFATVLPANAKVRIRVSTGHIFASNNQVNTTFSGYLVS
jgi:hypothetical protein